MGNPGSAKKQSGKKIYSNTYNNHSIGLKRAGEPRKGVSPSTVYVSSPDVKSERKYRR